MILDILKPKRTVKISKESKISALKAVTWRIVGTIDTMIISYFLTGKIVIALSIGGFEVFSKMFLYFLHEKAWARWTRWTRE